MYSNEKIGRLNQSTSIQASRLNQSTSIQASRLNESTSIQATQSNKTGPVFVELKIPFIGEPTIEFAKQANLTALKSFRSTVSVESQVRIIEKLYNFHTSGIEFDESLEKYHAFNEKEFLATPLTALIQYLKVSMVLDSRFPLAYAKFGLMKNEALHKDVMEYLADKKIIETQYTSKKCGQELNRLCDIVKPYIAESEKIVESRIRDISRDIVGKYKIENERLIDQLSEAKQDIKTLNLRIEQLESSKQETEANLTIAEEKHEELITRKSLTEEQIAMSQDKMAEYFNETNMEEGSELNNPGYEKLLEAHRKLETDYKQIIEELKIYQDEIENLKKELLFSRDELEKLALAKENSTKEFENLREELRLSRAAQESSELNIKNYKSEIVDLTTRIELKEKQSTDLSELKNKLEVSELKNQELMSKLAGLLEIEKAYIALTQSKENVTEANLA